LRRLQQGESLSMPLARPMPRVGSGCHELRVGDFEINVEWRVMYYVDENAVVVLEVWKKGSRQTPQCEPRPSPAIFEGQRGNLMDEKTRAALNAAGFCETTVQELLGLSF